MSVKMLEASAGIAQIKIGVAHGVAASDLAGGTAAAESVGRSPSAGLNGVVLEKLNGQKRNIGGCSDGFRWLLQQPEVLRVQHIVLRLVLENFHGQAVEVGWSDRFDFFCQVLSDLVFQCNKLSKMLYY